MLNRYPLWKNLLIVMVLAIAGIYAAPNLYPEDYAVQISGSRAVHQVDDRVMAQAVSLLEQEGIQFKSAELENEAGMLRFSDGDAQLLARAALARSLGENYVVAMNLAPTTPDWLTALGAGPMTLGLDLRGGVHFLMEVDTDQAVTQRLEVYASDIRTTLREQRIRYRSVDLNEDGLLAARFADAEARDQAQSRLRRDFPEFAFETAQEDDAWFLYVTLNEQSVREIEDYAIQQNLTTLRNRVNELGVAEPLVQRQGRNRIVVQLPGIQDAAAAKRVIGQTANLEFRLEALSEASRAATEVFQFRNDPDRRATLERDLIITGSSVANANATFDENGMPQVSITLDARGGQMMSRVTRNALQRRMAVVFVEHKTRYVTEQVDGETVERRVPYTEKRLISLATIQSVLGNQFRITGLDSPRESSELALLLRAGALAAPIYFVEERTIGPSLGAANIEMGVTSVKIGFALVLVFMAIFYRVFGLLANIALTLNLVMLVAVMSMLGATLTLPGIAGIVLTVGMAVDANVLIFERIKEELRSGSPVQSAIHSGFGRAFSTILDANVTTLIAAIILFAMGTGPVKGFAVTLSVGIITSMFAALVITRALVNLAYGGRKLQKLGL